ncbi:unnamed protein product [Ilex paraguariensis]|uniref:Uncharacterized protein n=1 Tax=Ilex paraguariensis TaxID=185542 RepID=A0ABC8TV10_9AQUA
MSHRLQQLDLRHTFLVVINGVKFIGHQTSSDPFHIISNLTWPKFTFLAITFFFFSFTSFIVPLSPTSLNHLQRELHVRVGTFSPTFAILLVASLLFPQKLFWYAYPIIIFLSFCSTRLSNLFMSFLLWAQDNLCENIHALNCIITATCAVGPNQEATQIHQAGQEIEMAYPYPQQEESDNFEDGVIQLDIQAL